MLLTTVILADVVPVISPGVFIQSNVVIVHADSRTPVVVCVVTEVWWRESYDSHTKKYVAHVAKLKQELSYWYHAILWCSWQLSKNNIILHIHTANPSISDMNSNSNSMSNAYKNSREDETTSTFLLRLSLYGRGCSRISELSARLPFSGADSC